jgi:transposase-like protein
VAHRGRRNADEALALALAAGQTLRDAAQAVGIGERTATRRWADADFRRRVADLRGAMVERAMGRMADAMTEAADTLRQLLHAEAESVRLGAARGILELAIKLRESVENAAAIADIESKLAELERRRQGETTWQGNGHSPRPR